MSNHSAPGFKRSLSLWQVVLFGLAFMAPATFYFTYGVAVSIAGGMISTAYAIAMVVMLFTAYSYGKLVKEFPIAGSAYSFTQKGMSPHLGFLVGWTIILDYLFSPMISSLLVGISLSAFFPSVPMAVWIILFISVIATVNILGIKIAANVNTLLVLLQVLFCAVFIIFSIIGLAKGLGTGTLVSITPIFDPSVKIGALIATVPILCFTFLGFDAVTTLSEETKNPRSTLPKAILLIPLIGGILYIASAYFAQLVYPDFSSIQDPESAYLQIFDYIGGNLLNSFFLAVGLTAAFASAVASCASSARILYAMGRERVLPNKVFGYLSPKFNTPVYNILVIAAIALSALFLDVVTATSLINYGALFAFTFVNLAVIVHFYIRKKQRSIKGTILYLLIPLIGAFFTAAFWLQLDIHSMILGSVWLLCGLVYLMYLTKMFRQAPPELHLEAAEQAG